MLRIFRKVYKICGTYFTWFSYQGKKQPKNPENDVKKYE